MSDTPLSEGPADAAYWHERVREEARAALDSDDPRVAAIHVELATRFLRRAREERGAGQRADFDFAAENA